jgi:hypothetical protein
LTFPDIGADEYTPGPACQEPITKYPIINLHRIYPNPFARFATIKYNLVQIGRVTVKIYNCLGNETRTLFDQHQSVGAYSVNWDGKDNIGNNLPNGIYICQLKTRNQVEHRQLILVK